MKAAQRISASRILSWVPNRPIWASSVGCGRAGELIHSVPRRGALRRIGGGAAAVVTTLFVATVVASFSPDSATAAATLLPPVSTGSATPDISPSRVRVYGRIEGAFNECRFEYGVDASYGSGSVPCSYEPSQNGQDNVDADLPNLQFGDSYHYRLAAVVEGTTDHGEDKTITQSQIIGEPGIPIFAFAPAVSNTQAGGHPNVTTSFFFSFDGIAGYPSSCFCQNAENITSHLPAGVVGNPHSTPLCTAAQMGDSTCPSDTQVGWTWTGLFNAYFFSPVYNVETDPDQAGLLGFTSPFTDTPLFIELSARTGGDYGLDTTIRGIEQVSPIEAVELTLWGVPASPSHDAYRVPYGVATAGCDTYAPQPEHENASLCFNPQSSSSPQTPFLDNPTSCGPLSSSLEILAYNEKVSETSSAYPATTGCDQLSFNPSLSAQPTTTSTDTPSGLEVNLSVPQEESPETPSPSEIRSTTVLLPEGFSLNPGSVDGKSACTDAEAKLGTPEEAQCPETSKVGTLSLDSSALPAPIPGFVYLLQPKPGDRYRVLLSANGFATHIKLVGSVAPEPGDRPSHRLFRQPSTESAHRLQHPFFRFRTRPVGHAHSVRGICGAELLRSMGRSPARTDGNSVLHS